ncbi:hypothetical protein GS444_15250 [Rhodococcus hoagii]|nr:hypothetical protein [Prescottella equi]
MWWLHYQRRPRHRQLPQGIEDDDGQCGSTSSTSASTAPGQQAVRGVGRWPITLAAGLEHLGPSTWLLLVWGGRDQP